MNLYTYVGDLLQIVELILDTLGLVDAETLYDTGQQNFSNECRFYRYIEEVHTFYEIWNRD